MTDERELELKYSVSDPAAVREMLGESIAGLAIGPAREINVVDRYVDTPSGALGRAGYGARLRHAQRQTTLTLKSQSADEGALHDRLELEGTATRNLDPRRWPASGARALLEATVGEERLRSLFVIEQWREEHDLTAADGAIVATLSLDEAQVRRSGRQLGTFWTLEVESHAATAVAGRRLLAAIAALLDAAACVAPEIRSKEQIGLALVAAAAAAAQPAKPPRTPGVTADDTLAEAGRKVLRMHMLRMLELAPAVRTDRNPDAVHRMRVATRRMRAAWRVFDGAYQRPLARRYVAELRGVAAALGRVRDLDVQLERLDEYRLPLEAPAAAALGPLADEWQYRRRRARLELLAMLVSPAYDRFVDDYRAFVETPAAGARPNDQRRVRDAAGSRIWAAYENVIVHDVTLGWADVSALHALRIDGKRLRYALEFFAEVLPPAAARLIADVTAMQDHLGLLNDAVVATAVTREWLDDATTPPATRKAAAAYLEASAADIARLRRTFRRLWRRVGGRTFRRQLAAVIGALGP